VQFLSAQAALIEPRIPAESDVNESVQYILNGIRKLPVKLIQLDSDDPLRLGPYELLVLQVHVAGEVRHLDALLEWLETDQRLFRIDSIKLEPPRGGAGEPLLKFNLLALRGRP
jgi:hypothetical protein